MARPGRARPPATASGRRLPHANHPGRATQARAATSSSKRCAIPWSTLRPFALDPGPFVGDAPLLVGAALLGDTALPAAALLTHDASILDAHDAIRKRHYTRVMGHHQHRTRRIPGNVREHVHDGVSVLAVEGGGRLVGENRRRVADDGARDRDALLLAAAKLARIGFDLVREPDRGQGILGSLDRGAPAFPAYVEDQADIVERRECRKEMVGLEHEPDMIAPQPREVFGAGAFGRVAAH